MINSVLHGDCLEVLKTLPDDSVDSIVTDPPAGIAFMGKHWDKDKGGRQQWIAWMSEVAAECLRVIKPGGHALVWAIPRTSHWTGTAWEDAGWECRDKIFHCFGSGFPKSLDVSKAIDRAAGAEREVVGYADRWTGKGNALNFSTDRPQSEVLVTGAPATAEAQQWAGWGTALKPAVEEWWLFRKPLAEKTVAGNVLEHGTGALNIDGCRVGTDDNTTRNNNATMGFRGCKVSFVGGGNPQGRFPAHLIHDGSDEVLACFPETHGAGYAKDRGGFSRMDNTSIFKNSKGGIGQEGFGGARFGDSGSAARFFYCAKASKRDRDEGLDGFELKRCGGMTGTEEATLLTSSGNVRDTKRSNHHPTVKPTELMRYLCRLITPPGGLILDPFCGSGSTGKGAVLEGFDFIGIEQDAEYVEIARARIAHVSPEISLATAHQIPTKTSQPQQLSLFA